MATTTTNLGLTKPESTDFYNIEDMNGNSDILDEEVSKRAIGEGLTFSVSAQGILQVTYEEE